MVRPLYQEKGFGMNTKECQLNSIPERHSSEGGGGTARPDEIWGTQERKQRTPGVDQYPEEKGEFERGEANLLEGARSSLLGERGGGGSVISRPGGGGEVG